MKWIPLANAREKANPNSMDGGNADFWDLSQEEWSEEAISPESTLVSEVLEKINTLGYSGAFSAINLDDEPGQYSVRNWEALSGAEGATPETSWSEDFAFNIDRRLRVLARFGDPMAMAALAAQATMRISNDSSEDERESLAFEIARWYARARQILDRTGDGDDDLNNWIEGVRGWVVNMFEVLEHAGAVTPELTASDLQAFINLDWMQPVCRAHGRTEHYVDDGPLCCLFLNMDPTKIAESIDTPEGLKDYDVCVEILSDSFLWDLDDTALDNLSDFRHYILERWDVDWDVSVGQANGQLFFEDLLLRFPELDAEDELYSESRSRIRGEYEDGLEISHQATFDLTVTAQSAEEAYFFVKRFAHKVFFHSSHSAEDLAVDEVRVLLVDGMKFDSGVAE